jgi:hypothetical protein
VCPGQVSHQTISSISLQDLIRRLLNPFADYPSPTTPLAPPDASLLRVSKELGGVSPALLQGLANEPEHSIMSPLDAMASDEIRITCASNLDSRLLLFKQGHRTSIGALESLVARDSHPLPDAPLPTSEVTTANLVGSPSSQRRGVPIPQASVVHPKHISSLIRLLFLHSCLNPANSSPNLPCLLIPLYSVLVQETQPQDLAHVEADTFWLFEAMVGEFAELEDEDGGKFWLKRLSERLSWADVELSIDLVRGPMAKNLDYHIDSLYRSWPRG